MFVFLFLSGSLLSSVRTSSAHKIRTAHAIGYNNTYSQSVLHAWAFLPAKMVIVKIKRVFVVIICRLTVVQIKNSN